MDVCVSDRDRTRQTLSQSDTLTSIWRDRHYLGLTHTRPYDETDTFPVWHTHVHMMSAGLLVCVRMLTFIIKCRHLNWSALQKSSTDTWHSRSSVSAQSRRSNVNANCGRCGEDGQIRARIIVTTRGSQAQDANLTVCSPPMMENNCSWLCRCAWHTWTIITCYINLLTWDPLPYLSCFKIRLWLTLERWMKTNHFVQAVR